MFAALWAQLVDLLVQNQMAVYAALSAVLTSAVMWFASRRIPGFAGLGNNAKRVIAAVAAIVTTILVQMVGGTPDGGLSLAGIIFGTGLALGTVQPVVSMVKTQPSNDDQFEHLQATGKLPARKGGALASLLALVVVVGILVACVQKVAAQPRGEILLADLRIAAPCSGPATMTGCVISLYDSTANVSLATAVAVAKGDTLWRTRTCEVNGTVVIGGTFVGTAPGKSPSDPVLVRQTGACSAQAGSPNAVLIIKVEP